MGVPGGQGAQVPTGRESGVTFSGSCRSAPLAWLRGSEGDSRKPLRCLVRPPKEPLLSGLAPAQAVGRAAGQVSCPAPPGAGTSCRALPGGDGARAAHCPSQAAPLAGRPRRGPPGPSAPTSTKGAAAACGDSLLCWGWGREAAAPRGLGRGRRHHRRAPAPALRPRWGGARAPPAPPCPGWAGPPGAAGRWAAVLPDHLGQDLRALVCGRERVLRKRRAPPPHLPGAEVPDPSPRGQAPPLPVTPSSLPWPSCCASSAGGVSLGASRTPPNPSLGRGSFCPCSAGRPGDGAHLTWAAGRPGWGSGPLWVPAPASSGRLQETALGPGLRAGAP